MGSLTQRSLRAVLAATLVVAGGMAVAYGGDSETPQPTIGQKVENFTLNDFRGSPRSLADFADRQVVVLAFVGVECPLAKLYAPRLAEIAREYENRGVALIGISSNRQDSVTELAAYARQHEIAFPILKDVGNHVADRVGARRTPEVVVLDRDRVVRYQGRVDDHYGVGVQRTKPTSEDLRAAIDALLLDKPVANAETEVVGCLIGRTRQPDEDSRVTYSKQVARVLQKRCVQCHRAGDIGPFALTSYDEVAGWAEMIQEVVRDNRMPPWHADPTHGKFANDRRMTDEEKKIIYDWVAAGAPEGDASDLPPPKEYVAGWRLPREPDLVLAMRDKPFQIPAEGEVKYQYFDVDPGFTEDKWVQMAQVLPGNPSVVHHIIVFVRSAGGDTIFEGGRGKHLTAYVPGMMHQPYPSGMAKRIPAGSKLVFQVHYTPTGSPQEDLSQVGFVFADGATVRMEAETRVVGNRTFKIPPFADDYRIESNTGTFGERTLLLSMSPHMHVRGKSFHYEIARPDGAVETLLDVPHYDFNWQTNYEMEMPRWLEPGTVIRCSATFDNSENNLANPDPSDTVRWGDQTWEEMMLGYYEVAIPRKAPSARAGRRKAAAKPAAEDQYDKQAALFIAPFDADKDGHLNRDEAPKQIAEFFDLIDADGDDLVSPHELRAAVEEMQKRAKR